MESVTASLGEADEEMLFPTPTPIPSPIPIPCVEIGVFDAENGVLAEFCAEKSFFDVEIGVFDVEILSDEEN